jgi:hemoglobin
MTTQNLPDIKTETDVRAFVDDFYAKVTVDPMLGPIFNEIAGVDWAEHLPTMYRFWGSMLLGTRNYKGVPFPPHAALRAHITPAHFTRWLTLFTESIDKLFQGEMADTAKQRAMNIAFIFQSKLSMMAREPAVAGQSPTH